MTGYQLRTITDPAQAALLALLVQEPGNWHIHALDMPYRLSSTWQDHGGEIGLWERDGELLAWALFLPPWWNVDYALHESVRGTALEAEIFAWGKAQMNAYATRSGEDFWGSFEFFADAPGAEQTRHALEAQGFQPFTWSTLRLTLDLRQELAPPELPAGFQVRPLAGAAEAAAYVQLHRDVFNSDRMTLAWRLRTLAQAAYRPDLDLLLVDPAGTLAGFCVCWVSGADAHIEPLGIHPDFQGQGLGKALERTAAHRLRDQGITTLHIDHASFNETALAVSQQSGFKLSRTALRYYVEIEP